MSTENGNMRRQRFEKIGSKRVQKILDDIDILGNCSNRNNYEYSDADIKKMISAIKRKLKHLEMTFTNQTGRTRQTFKF